MYTRTRDSLRATVVATFGAEARSPSRSTASCRAAVGAVRSAGHSSETVGLAVEALEITVSKASGRLASPSLVEGPTLATRLFGGGSSTFPVM